MVERSPASGAVRDELRERLFGSASARWAWRALLLCAALAIYAPLIANDRPYRLVWVEGGQVRRELQMLDVVSRRMVELSRSGSAREASVEGRALSSKARTLGEAFVEAEDRRRLAAWADRMELASLCEPLDPVALEGLALEARELRTLLSPGEANGAGGRPLVQRASWPLFAALDTWDWAWMWAWPVIAWSARPGRRALDAARRSKSFWRTSAALLGAVLLGAACAWILPEPPSGSIKDRIARGEAEVQVVAFPPCALGFGETHLEEPFAPPSWWKQSGLLSAVVRPGERSAGDPARHLLGTDVLGRDLFARLLWGGRVTLSVGLTAACGLTLIGVILGAWAGWRGGWPDAVVSRAIELVQSFPVLFLVLLAVGSSDMGSASAGVLVVLVIVGFGWTGVARILRAECARLTRSDLVLALRSLGYSPRRILWLHVVPNALPAAIVAFVFAAAHAMLLESSLSFLGFGIQEPVPSWGSLIGESQSVQHWWMLVFPGAILLLSVLALLRLGEALRDALDPRHVEVRRG